MAQGIEVLPIQLLGPQNGLLETDNRFMLKDEEGFLWFSSVAGLHRFDGISIKKYTSADKDSTSIRGRNINGYMFEDHLHSIWFSTSEAINCYSKETDGFTSYIYPDSQRHVYFTCALDAQDQLWLYCDNALLTLNIKTHDFRFISSITPNAQHAKVCLNSQGLVTHIFIYSFDRAHPGFQMLEFTPEGRIRKEHYFNGVNEPVFPIRGMFIQGDSLAWLACKSGIIRFDIRSKTYQIFSPEVNQEYIYFNAISSWNDTLLLAISYGEGAFTFSTSSLQFKDHYYLTLNDHVLTDHPQAIYTDKEGGIWICIPGSGIGFFHPGNLAFQTFRQTVKTEISTSSLHPNSLLELPDHQVWISSNTVGAIVLKNPFEISKQYHKGSPKHWKADVTFMSERDKHGRIWTLTAEGPCYMQEDGTWVNPEVREGITFSNMSPLPNGDVILSSTDHGLYKGTPMSNGSLRFEPIHQDILTASYHYLFTHTDGNLYAASYQSHIDVYQPSQNFRLLLRIPMEVDVQCMEPVNPGPSIYMGTDRGLWIYDPESGTIDKLLWAPELWDLIVFGVVPVPHHQVWMSTNNGIFFIDHKNQSYTRYGMENGIGSQIFNRNSYLHSSNGEIWFGNNDGFTIFNPANVKTILPSPRVVFSRLMINDAESPGLKPFSSNHLNGSAVSGLRLPYIWNTFSVEFAAVSYNGVNQALYEYRMMGMEENWISSGHRGFARYANLDPGDYVFEVRAKQDHSEVYSPVRSIAIKIIAPLYRRTWFIVLVVLSISCLLLYIYHLYQKRKNRIRQLIFEKKLALESERLRIANDMHDDLGSGLSALSLRARLLADQVRNPELASQFSELVENTNRLAQQIRETIWTINSQYDAYDSLMTRLHQYALDYFEGSGISCMVTLPQEQNFTPIAGSVRREIYLTYKEALHNIFKHAGASQVMIRLFTEESRKLVIEIRDNGHGFDMHAKSPGIGLDSMRKRMKDIGGEISLASDDRGTSIIIRYQP